MYNVTIVLKQHTPLIHFQHDQEGVTLRASEVKPRLDRFIKSILPMYFSEISNRYSNIISEIFAKEKQNSYKMVIEQDENEPEKYIIGSYISKQKSENYKSKGYKVLGGTPYFADSESIKNENIPSKLGLMLNKEDKLYLKIFFHKKEWEDLFKEIIPIFFSITNFGSRQNKGFGCFYPESLTKNELENNLKIYSKQIIYKSNKKINYFSPTFYNEIFSEIDLLYKTLKSGTQSKESMLRKYLRKNNEQIDWEKDVIKLKIKQLFLQNQVPIKYPESNNFARALLGLPEIYEFPKFQMKVKVNPEKENDSIERYQSPLLFKVFNNNIYILIDDEEDQMTNKNFSFDFNNNGRNYGKQLYLKTPKDFKIGDFLRFAMKFQYSWDKI